MTVVNLLVLAMLFNSASAAALSVSGSERVQLCTSTGYQWVDVESDQRLQLSGSHCVFCLNSGDDEPLAVVSERSVFKSFTHSPPQAQSVSVSLKKLGLHSAQARAPPVNL